MAQQTLAQRVRSRHPGAYDDLSDQALEQAVIAKYPGTYDDLPRTTGAGLRPEWLMSPSQPRASVGETARDVVGGLRSTVARTVFGGGDLVRQGLGMERVIDRPEVQAWMTAPDSTAGRVASAVGDVAQFFLPTGAVGKVRQGAEIVKAGALTLAQTGDPATAGVSAGITAVVPGVGAARTFSRNLQASAEKSMTQALGATTRPLKAQAATLAPQMLARGTRGTRRTMLDQAEKAVSTLGDELNAAYDAAAASGEAVSGATVRRTVTRAAETFRVPNAAGSRVVIPGAEPIVQRLQALDEFIGTLGDDIPVNHAAHLKRTWDDIASSAGLFGSDLASATDKAAARAFKAASDSFRTLLNTNPTLAALNKELSFQIGLKKVLKATVSRTQSQSSGLVAAGFGAAGMAAGVASGDSLLDRLEKGALGGLAAKHLVKIVQSPHFRTSVSAPLKKQLADALASGRTGNLMAALSRISAAMPGQLSSAIGATR